MNARVGNPTVERGPSITGGAPKINLSQMLGMDADFLRQARAAVGSADWSLTPTQVKEKTRHEREAEIVAAREVQLPQARAGKPVEVAGQPTPVVEGGVSAEERQRMHLSTVAEVTTGGQARTRGATAADLSEAIRDGSEGRARVGQGSVVKEFAQLERAAGEIFGDTGRSILGTLVAPLANMGRQAPESEILRS